MFKLSVSLIFILNTCLMLTPAWSLTPAQALKQALARSSQFKTYEGEFVQNIVYPNHQKEETSSGRFYLKKPNHLRWEVKQPYPSLMMTDGLRVYQYDPRLKQVKIRPFKSKQPLLQALILSQMQAPDLQGYRVTRGSQAGVFRLDARYASLSIKRMDVVFQNHALVWVNALDTMGYAFTLQFKPLKYNHPLPAHLFQWPQALGIRPN